MTRRFSKRAIGRRGLLCLETATACLGARQWQILRKLEELPTEGSATAASLTRRTATFLPGHAAEVLKTLHRRHLVERVDGESPRAAVFTWHTRWRLSGLGRDVVEIAE